MKSKRLKFFPNCLRSGAIDRYKYHSNFININFIWMKFCKCFQHLKSEISQPEQRLPWLLWTLSFVDIIMRHLIKATFSQKAVLLPQFHVSVPSTRFSLKYWHFSDTTHTKLCHQQYFMWIIVYHKQQRFPMLPRLDQVSNYRPTPQ